MRARRLALWCALATLPLAPARGAAQTELLRRTSLEAIASSDLETYLRVLQAGAQVPARSWSMRAFTPREAERMLRADTSHPWLPRFISSADTPPRLVILRPSLAVRYNSGFAFGGNEWGVWSGRGLTTTMRAGLALRAGPVTLRVEPMIARAQNASFALQRVDDSTASPFADPQFPTRIDLPQRFGDTPYVQVLPGESYLTVEGHGAMVSLSTASESWGPAQVFPFILGNNAGGFLHLSAGTSRPVSIGIGRLEARYLVGRLDQSDYFSAGVRLYRERRVANALILALQPRGLKGLELGLSRFFHAPYPDAGLRTRDFTRVFETPFKSGIDSIPEDVGAGDIQSRDGENQLAGVFLRWLAPRGLEVWGEAGREDHPWDARDLLTLPDKHLALGFGLRRTWSSSATSRRVARFEQLSYLQNSASRNGQAFSHITYIHGSGANQGHTSRGLLLGANLGGGSASGMDGGLDIYDARGRRSLTVQRIVRRDQRTAAAGGVRNERAYDTQYVLSADRLWFGRSMDINTTVYGVYNFNRYFAGDAVNLGMRVTIAPGR